jgi:hypothetical protein
MLEKQKAIRQRDLSHLKTQSCPKLSSQHHPLRNNGWIYFLILRNLILKSPKVTMIVIAITVKRQLRHHFGVLQTCHQLEIPDHDLPELVIRNVGLEYISRRAIRLQKYYMRRCHFMGPSVSVQQNVER